MRRIIRLHSLLPGIRRLALAFSFAVLAAVAWGTLSSAQSPGPCDPPNGNAITCENQKPGNPESEWDISGAGDGSIQGFATDISVNRGQTVSFKIDTPAAAYRLDIYRMGYYGGLGARKVATVLPSATLPQNQPDCLSDSATGLLDCGNWGVSASWAVPADAVSGIYFARAIRTDTGGASHIVFIVRNDDGHSKVLFQTSDTTWQAYNQYGGNSLYVGGPATNPGRAYKVSYNRPFTTRGTTAEDWVFNAEYPMVRWLEANGYDVSYFTGVDANRRGAEILEHQAYLSVGHDEYWSGTQRTNVETARAAGVHLAFFSGNEIFWKTRWENSISSPATAYRTLVSYKETHANAKIDPAGAGVWTGTWADPRFSPPADGGRPQNALTGTFFQANCCTYAITVPAADGRMRFWRGTSIAGLGAGQVATLPDGTLGYEWDADADNGFRPAGLVRMSDTTVDVPSGLLDYGSTYGAAIVNHALTLYRHPSGALVFGAGTVQWSWGLDSHHDRGSEPPSLDMEQATVNLLADMGVQPLTIGPGLLTATPSTDTLAPTSSITTPASGGSVPANTTITVAGAASDGGGGLVGGVEVSVDGGATWHPALGREAWTYSWQTGSARTVTLFSRAVDDSGNLEQPVTGVTVTVGSGPVTCPCSIWTPSQTPAVAAENDASAVEVGTRFRADTDGFITAIRFYKSAQNIGPHVGNLWTASGSLLATVTFSGETASGWQEAILGAPVAISANTSYIVSYHTPSGFYAGDDQYFANGGVDNGPLHALRNGEDGPNGVYKYGPTGFPTQTYNSENYWVDIVFEASVGPDTTPPQVLQLGPGSGATGVPIGAAVTGTFNENLDPASVSSGTFQLRSADGTLIGASVSYSAGTRTAALQPSAPLTNGSTYTATLRGGPSGVTDAAGNALAADVTWSFTTAATGSGQCPCSIWPTESPSVGPDEDPSALELGTRFRSDVNGYITGIRFYKADQNTGQHTGSLWTGDGALLTTVDFSGETASGWQEAALPTPIPVTAGTTYVVSYHTNTGFYVGQDGYFAAAGVDSGPLHAPRTGADGPNGVFRYGTSGFPDRTFQGENYWVDVVFDTAVGPDTTAPTVSALVPQNGQTAVPASASVKAIFSESVNPATVAASTFQLRDSGGTLVPASVTYLAATRTAVLTPNATLAYTSTFSARVVGGASGVKDPAGNPLAVDVTWTFTTAGPPPPPPTSGPGGPILVVGSASNPFSQYYAEILRAEGLNAFGTADVSQVTGTMLSAYDVVILGQVPLTTTQVTTFTNWVNTGGNLIAMRPDKKLASLLGLTDAAATLSEGYMKVNTSAAPGAGIVGETMQFHGVADRYTLNGAAPVATLYSNATTATANPAVSLRSVGTNGGQAAAFAYDLARSVVFTRQGNPAWAGQERDGITPIRSDDLFFGGSEPNYVDLSKVAIPQADEQQRLLANLLEVMNADRKPLPKFWYFPRGLQAVVVMTGDDHASNGTAGRFDIYNADSPAGCSVDDWECVRASSYLFLNTPISNAQVTSYTAQGFDIGVHILTGCGNYTPASIESTYTSDLTEFAALFPGAPAPSTSRTHCIAWSDYVSQAQAELNHGIRLDTNYYYWPGTWVNNIPGLFTGSGMPMRFAAADGTMIDVYQATTQMTDESGQSYPFTIDTLLDRALGPEGYYGAFVANMHTDSVVHPGSEAIVASAQSRGVPIISAKQLLRWLDGRNGSTFAGIVRTGSTLSFTVTNGTGANGLQAMVPAVSSSGVVTGVRRDGTPIVYGLRTVKGMSYAVFSATAGAYVVEYGSDTTPPVISNVSAAAGETTATITWTTNEPSSSRVDYGLAPAALTLSAVQGGDLTAHSVALSGLSGNTQYYYRVTSVDPLGNSSSAPSTPATFSTVTQPTGPQCPCSIWPASQTPAVVAANEGTAVELGTRFRTDVNGYITGVRFYKSLQNTGTHVGNLWTASGVRLATVTFSEESPSGWQEATFSSPVAVTAGTTYVVSYHTNTGFYSINDRYFATAGADNPPLHALANGVDGPNGVFAYGAGGFPTSSFHSSNYWVDVVFATSVSADTTPPAISAVSATPADTTATISWTTNENATSRVDYGLTSSALTSTASAPGSTTSHTVSLAGLTAGTQYFYRVTSVDAAGNSASAPASPATFTTAPLPTVAVGDATLADFSSGTLATGAYLANTQGGEVMLAPTVGAEFEGAAMPAGWMTTAWNTGGAGTITAGHLLVDGVRTHTDAFFGPGASLKFSATFNGNKFQHAGFGVTLDETPWAIFSTGFGGALYARTHTGSTATDTPIPGDWLNAPHRYRIDWNTSSVVFWIDGVQVASHPVTIGTAMRPIVSDVTVNGAGVIVDWMRLAPYAGAGTFTSRVIDSGTIHAWATASWTATTPAGTSLALSARFGNTATPDGTWTGFVTLPASGTALSQTSRYVQYRVVLTSTVPGDTPSLKDITFTAQ